MKLILETSIKPVPINRKLKRPKSGGLYIDKKYSDTWELIRWDWIRQLQSIKDFKPFENVAVGHSFGYPKFDIDSLQKEILDSLAKIGVYKNDRQVNEVLYIKRIKEPKLIVEVTDC